MEATAVSVGKAVLDGALGYAKSKAAEEMALQLGVEGDVDFIRDELQMMQSFLMTADEEQSQNKVLTTWVKQIGVLAYKVEDSLMDFGLHSEKKPFLRCIPRNPWDRRRIAKEVKELRAKVEDVSNRNLRYRLIKESSGSKPTVTEEQASTAAAVMFAAVEHDSSSKVNLHQLVTSNDVNLRVISMWGTSGDLGKTSAIQEVYDDPEVLKRFRFRAWIRLMHPFNPQEFLRSLVRQFYENSCDEVGNPSLNPQEFLRSLVRQFYENSHDEVGKLEQETSVGAVLAKMEKMDQSDLVPVFNAQLCSNSYLVVIDDLSTIVEWHCIKKYFPDNKKQSRIIVSTQLAEIASLCTGNPYQVSEFIQLSCDRTIYLFHKKDSEEQVRMGNGSVVMLDTNDEVMLAAVEKEKRKEEDQEPNNASEEKVHNSTARNKLDRSRTLALADEVICGRETEKSNLIELVGQPDNTEDCKVISVWGMGGLGKTTLVRSIYRNQQLGGWKRAWATALRPFNLEVLLRDLALQLQNTVQEDPAGATSTVAQKKSIREMDLNELKKELDRVLVGGKKKNENEKEEEKEKKGKEKEKEEEKKKKKCLIVLDDISSTSEWDLVKSFLDHAGRIIITTREKNIAEHCSKEDKNLYHLKGLKDDAALELFMKKVFKNNIEKINLVPAMMEQARLTLQKCDGLPLAISTIGGSLATKPKTAIAWKMMNDHISTELEINPEFRIIKTILMRSYDDLPYHLKSAFLYLSIFSEDHIIRWGRLVRRWIVEGYSRDMHGMTALEICRKYFDELLDRGIILPGERIAHYSQKINSCQLHDMFRQICISKAREENLVFTLEEGCCLIDTQGAIRHLVIGSNWIRDKDELESMLDLSHVRSLTVFGEWRSFLISDNMRFLRVLDLEDTSGLRDHHLDKIGQLRHLMYLSLRGCHTISCLPSSLRNLRHLETLDVRGTCVYELPTTITNLQKLQHLRADGLCGARLKRCDLFSLYRFSNEHRENVVLPTRIGKLKALRTLGVVDFSRRNGKATVNELRELTQLRKIKVDDMSYRNINKFWSAIAHHNQLQSVSVKVVNVLGEKRYQLDEGFSPPRSLESLTLYGKLANATRWIHKLQNLSKLVLENSRLEQDDDAIRALGCLPHLAVLRLKTDSFRGRRLHFQRSSFLSLMVLELDTLKILISVLFEENSMSKLELLQVGCCGQFRNGLNDISGLPALTSLKEIRLAACYGAHNAIKERCPGFHLNVQKEVQRQVEHMEHVRVNII